MRLYRSPSQSLVTAAVSPILRSDGDAKTSGFTDSQGVCDGGQDQLANSEKDDHDRNPSSQENQLTVKSA